jgi:single-strand DNA-binding protein
LITQDNLPITSFRLAEDTKVWDKNLNKFVAGQINWFTVTCFGQLALNAKESVSKGDRVIVYGALLIRDWDNGERAGTSVEIEATALGHDLFYGNSVFTRTTNLTAKDNEND